MSWNFPIGSILKIQTYCTAPGQVAVMTHKFQMTSLTGGSVFNSLTFLADFDFQMSLLIPPLLSNGAKYYGVQAYLMNPIGMAPRPDNTVPADIPGTGGAGLLPTQSSGLISWYTDYAGKQGQGRTYVPFPSPVHSEADGTPTTAYITGLQNLSAYLRAPITVVDTPRTAVFELVLYSGGSATPLFVTDATERNAWATQRRRGSYGRLNRLPF